MPLIFYPHPDDARKGTLQERIEVLMDAADRYRAAVLDVSASPVVSPEEAAKKRMIPRDQTFAYNWEEISAVLSEIRELPEVTKPDRAKKGDLLTRLAEVYEVLRAARMSKLEAVRLALISEANQLKGGNQSA